MAQRAWRNLLNLKDIHIIPLTRTSILPRLSPGGAIASGILSKPAYYPDVVWAYRFLVGRCTDFPKFNFPRTQGAIGMKTSVLAIVLATALAAGAQQPAPQTPPPAPAAPGQSAPSQAAPEIKDPAEYNAYVAAIQQTDATAKISNLEAFLVQYPNSVMKTTALELLMNTYLQANN